MAGAAGLNSVSNDLLAFFLLELTSTPKGGRSQEAGKTKVYLKGFEMKARGGEKNKWRLEKIKARRESRESAKFNKLPMNDRRSQSL